MNLTDYIKGCRHGRDAHRIEREAMSDPLLQDAIDGFDAVEGDHEEALRRLRQRLAAGMQPRKRRELLNFYRIAAAAALIGVMFLGYYMYSHRDEEPQTLLAYEPKETSETAMVPVEVVVPVVPATPKPEPKVFEDKIEIVDNNTEVETEQVFAEFDLDTAVSDTADTVDSTALERIMARPKESFTGAARAAAREEQSQLEPRNVIGALKSVDPSFYVLEDTLPLDSLNAIKAFDKYVAASGFVPEGRIVLEFTTNDKGRPTKICVVESNMDKDAERRAIRLLRNSGIAWPAGKTMRVVIE